MTQSDKRKLIMYFEQIESNEGKGLVLSLGIMASDVHYENGSAEVEEGTDGTAFIDFKFTARRRGRRRTGTQQEVSNDQA